MALFPGREVRLGGYLLGAVAIGVGCLAQLSQGNVTDHLYGRIVILFGLALIVLTILAGRYRAMLLVLRIVLTVVALMMVAAAILSEFYRR